MSRAWSRRSGNGIGVTADYKVDAYRLAQLGFNVLAPSLFNMFNIGGAVHSGQGADVQAKHTDGELRNARDPGPALAEFRRQRPPRGVAFLV